MVLRYDFPQLRLIIPDHEKMDADELLAMIGECADDAVGSARGWYNRWAINASSILHIFHLFGNSDLPVCVMHIARLQYRTVGGYMKDGVKTGIAAAAMTTGLPRLRASRMCCWSMIRPSTSGSSRRCSRPGRSR